MGGETGVVVFDRVPRPAAVQSVITEQIDALRHRAIVPAVAVGPRQRPGRRRGTRRVLAGGVRQRHGRRHAPVGHRPGCRVTAPGDDTVADRLVQLDELRRRGIVTDAEFASKKAELLDRL